MPAVRCRWPLAVVTLLSPLSLLACGDESPTTAPPTSADPPTTAGATTSTAASAATTAPSPAPQEVRLHLERRTDDAATAGFETFVRQALPDPRGWQRAGFAFTFSPDAPYVVVLAEREDVDALCRPYDVYGTYSCQNGPVVALHADRWRTATPEWTGTLDDYRRMLVNHEVGHLLGQHHPDVQCPGRGQPAPVMAQQSTELDGCVPNPWPLDWEVRCAALRLEPLAPGYEPNPSPLCGPDGPAG